RVAVNLPKLTGKVVSWGLLRITDILTLVGLIVTISGLPSPSISFIAILELLSPVVIATLLAKEMFPAVELLRNIERLLFIEFDITKSVLPSPSKSPTLTKDGAASVNQISF